MFYLAQFYEFGTTTTKDMDNAVKFYIEAANKGDSLAQYKVGNYYKTGLPNLKQDEAKAFKYLYKSYLEGNVDNCYFIGSIFLKGIDKVPQDFTVAVKMFQISDYYIDARFNLGLCYYNGFGVSRDYKRAYSYFINSTMEGRYMAGFCLETGKVQRDLAAAITQYIIAAKSGNENAKKSLKRLNINISEIN